MPIRDLPLMPSKKNPAWKRHQRPNGNHALEINGSVVEADVMDRLAARVKTEYRGRTMEEKINYLKQLIESHAKGEEPIGVPGGGRGEVDYNRTFEQFVQKLPKKFEDFVPQSVEAEGDKLIQAGKTTGYDIDSYGVGKGGEYSNLLREGANRLLYHQYTSHPEHGAELLRRMAKIGIRVPYTMSTVATAVQWNEEWADEPDVELDGDIGRSVQYVIAFKPQDPKEAEKLTDFFEKNAKHGQKESIEHSWFVPDIRSSFQEQVDAFDRNVLNVKPTESGYEIMVLKKEAIDGFRASNVWINKDLSKFVKSLAIFLLPPFKGPPVLFGKMEKSTDLSRIRIKDGVMVPARRGLSALGVRLGVVLKAVPKYWMKPDHKYIRRTGEPGHYKYEYPNEPVGAADVLVSKRDKDSIWVSFDFDWMVKERVKATGAWFDGKEKRWHMPISNIDKLVGAFANIVVDSSGRSAITGWLERDKLKGETTATPTGTRKIIREANKDNTKLDLPKSIKRNMLLGKDDMLDFQKKGVNWLMQAQRGILAFEMGLSKTLIGQTAAAIGQESGKYKHVNVLCPAKVVYNWVDELDKFFTGKSIAVLAPNKALLYQHGKEPRVISFEEAAKADFSVGSFGVLQRSPEKLKALKADVSIVDEAHNLKGRTSLQAQNYDEHMMTTPNVWFLTGSPSPNRPEDMFHMANHIRPGILGTWKEFLDTFCETEQVRVPKPPAKKDKTSKVLSKITGEDEDRSSGGGYMTVTKIVGYKNLDLMHKRVSPIMFVKKREDADVQRDLPPKQSFETLVSLEPDEMKEYREIAAGAKKEVDAMDEKEFAKNKTHVLALMQQCEMAAAKFKTETARELLQEHFSGGNKHGAVVFCHWLSGIAEMQKKLEDSGFPMSKVAVIKGQVSQLRAKEIANDFNTGKYKVLLASDAAKEGMNLQENSSFLINLDTPWVPGWLNQRNFRVWREGQKNPVTIVRLLAAGTIDEKKNKLLAQKQKWQDIIERGDASDSTDIGQMLTLDEVKELFSASA